MEGGTRAEETRRVTGRAGRRNGGKDNVGSEVWKGKEARGCRRERRNRSKLS